MVEFDLLLIFDIIWDVILKICKMVNVENACSLESQSLGYKLFMHRLFEGCDGDLGIPDLTRDCLRNATGETLGRLLTVVETVIGKSFRRTAIPLHAEVVSHGEEFRLVLEAVMREKAEEGPVFDGDEDCCRPKVWQREMASYFQQPRIRSAEF